MGRIEQSFFTYLYRHNPFQTLSLLRKWSFTIVVLFGLGGCFQKGPLGTKKNPIKFTIVPAQEMRLLQEVAATTEKWLNENSDLVFEVKIPNNYIAIVESLGSKKVDVAIINTFGYILAYDKYNVEARLSILNNGKSTYRGQIIARTDGPKSIKDIENKKFAFVDPTSTSGFLMASALLKKENVKPKETVFAGRHDTVVAMVYQGQVDAGATFHQDYKEDGILQDARRLLLKQYPDVFEKVRIIGVTDEILNDPLVFRREIPEEIKQKVTQLMLRFIKSETGQNSFTKLFKINGFIPSDDKRYDPVREMLKTLDKSANDMIK